MDHLIIFFKIEHKKESALIISLPNISLIYLELFLKIINMTFNSKNFRLS